MQTEAVKIQGLEAIESFVDMGKLWKNEGFVYVLELLWNKLSFRRIEPSKFIFSIFHHTQNMPVKFYYFILQDQRTDMFT